MLVIFSTATRRKFDLHKDRQKYTYEKNVQLI